MAKLGNIFNKEEIESLADLIEAAGEVIENLSVSK